MNEERFSISELASAAATTPRTIRFYTTEGLLPPPLSEGRNAIYTRVHRRRLRLIQRLKAAYLPLSAIKAQMEGLTDGQVDSLLERSGAHRVENTGPPHAQRQHAEANSDASTMAYVAQILAAAEQGLLGNSAGSELPASPRVLLVSAGLRGKDDTSTVTEPEADIELIAERWERILVHPGVELLLSEPVSDSHRAAARELARAAAELFRNLDK